MATEEVVPLGDVNLTVIRPEVVPAPKLKLKPAMVASDVLGTGEPPSRVTVRPVVVVDAETVVPAAMGFNRVPLASATIKTRLSDALDPVYQVSPAKRG
jgi:hypothetical protein